MNNSSVYIIVDDINNRIKIGKANNVKDRIKSFSYATINYDLSIELLCLDQTAAFKIEKIFHCRLHDSKIISKDIGRVDGKSEWFHLSALKDVPDLIEYLLKSDNRLLQVNYGLFQIKDFINKQIEEKVKKEEDKKQKEKEILQQKLDSEKKNSSEFKAFVNN